MNETEHHNAPPAPCKSAEERGGEPSHTASGAAQRMSAAARRLRAAARREPVLTVAAIAAIASMLAVPPSAQYAGYLRYDTLALLFCFMACVAGLRQAGLFPWLAARMLAHCHSVGAVAGVLVGLSFVCGALFSNDVTLLTFVPFSLLLLHSLNRLNLAPAVLTLQTIAANMGSTLTPFGNPHNLYASTVFNVPMGEFLATMAPFTCVSGLALAACVAVLGLRNRGAGVNALTTARSSSTSPAGDSAGAVISTRPTAAAASATAPAGPAAACTAAACTTPAAPASAPTAPAAASAAAPSAPSATPAAATRTAAILQAEAPQAFGTTLFSALFVLSILAVMKIVPPLAAAAIVAVVLLIFNRRLFAEIDWALLATFVCFFIFSGNIASLPALSSVLTSAMQTAPFAVTLGASQVISNVPATTLLGPFTTNWQALAIGADIGGLGSPVGSLASLITLGFYRSQCVAEGTGTIGGYMRTFLALGFSFLVLNALLYVLLHGSL